MYKFEKITDVVAKQTSYFVKKISGTILAQTYDANSASLIVRALKCI